MAGLIFMTTESLIRKMSQRVILPWRNGRSAASSRWDFIRLMPHQCRWFFTLPNNSLMNIMAMHLSPCAVHGIANRPLAMRLRVFVLKAASPSRSKLLHRDFYLTNINAGCIEVVWRASLKRRMVRFWYPMTPMELFTASPIPVRVKINIALGHPPTPGAQIFVLLMVRQLCRMTTLQVASRFNYWAPVKEGIHLR